MAREAIQIPGEVIDALVAHAREAAPSECCGVLLGRGGAVIESRRAANLAADPQRNFSVDPRDHIAARREARGRGLEIVGFYHSHPRSSATPSPTDVAEASYADALYVIIGLHPDVVVRAFKLSNGRLQPT